MGNLVFSRFSTFKEKNQKHYSKNGINGRLQPIFHENEEKSQKNMMGQNCFGTWREFQYFTNFCHFRQVNGKSRKFFLPKLGL